jgi:hypothetical protein
MDNEQQIEDLKNALREIMQMVVQRGQPLTSDLKMVLSDIMNHVAERIQELRQQGAPTDGMPPAGQQPPELGNSMPSSNISKFGYDEKTGQLMVQFLGKYPNANGPVYSYGGVPKQIFDLFRQGAVPARTDGKNRWGKWWKGKNPSMGASMYTLIKNAGYSYQRVS